MSAPTIYDMLNTAATQPPIRMGLVADAALSPTTQRFLSHYIMSVPTPAGWVWPLYELPDAIRELLLLLADTDDALARTEVAA